MTVISDTTCLSVLARLRRLELLHSLFGEVIMPQKVHEELLALSAFGVDVSIFTQLEWLIIQQPAASPLLERLLANKRIDAGESYSIALAVEIQADWVILDDLNARKVAIDMGLNITGLGGILLQAKSVGIITSVKEYLNLCIEKANFRLSQVVYERLLELAEEK